MGSRKTIFSLSVKHVAALASVLGTIGGITATTASAQNAQFESLNQAIRQVSHGQDLIPEPDVLPSQTNVARLAANTFSPRQAQNSARIIHSQHANRRSLVGRGRLVTTGFRQEPGVLGSLPQKPSRTVLQKEDKPQDFFGENQPCLLYTSPSPRDATLSRMPSSA